MDEHELLHTTSVVMQMSAHMERLKI